MNEEDWVGEVRKRNGGYTILEMIIVLAIVSIMTLVALGVSPSRDNGIHLFHYSRIEQQCVGGYLFVVDHQAGTTQIMDATGKGNQMQLTYKGIALSCGFKIRQLPHPKDAQYYWLGGCQTFPTEADAALDCCIKNGLIIEEVTDPT